MIGSHWRFGFLMIWGVFQSTEARKGECPDPQEIEFAEHSAYQYVVGTIAVYDCETGYKRKRGASRNLKCQNHTGNAQWQTETDLCIVDPQLPSEQPVTEKWKVTSSGLQATTQQVMKDFCGTPISPKHAIRVKLKYYMGQKLNYVCKDGYQARTPTVSTCEDLSGRIVWSKFTLSCTNDSSVAEEATAQPLDSVQTTKITGHDHTTKSHAVSATDWFNFPLVSVLIYLQLFYEELS